MGGGVQLRLMDSSAIMSRSLVDHALKVAEKKKYPLKSLFENQAEQMLEVFISQKTELDAAF